MDHWIWDVDKRFRKKAYWLKDVAGWYIRAAENGLFEAVATDHKDRLMVLFRGTKQKCREYIDEHTGGGDTD